MRPAFADVGTGRFLAHSVQAEIDNQLLDAGSLFLGRTRDQPRARLAAQHDLALKHAAKRGDITSFDAL